MSRILTLQRQIRELGRLRTGLMDGNRPVRSGTWVISSHSEDYVRAAATVWGGTPEKWQPQGNGAAQWRVVTTASVIDAILPPGDPLSQSLELWNRGGCARRCDGITENLSDSPCLCRAQFGDDFHEQRAGTVCSMTTRLNVMLPEMPDFGVWRAETHSYYAANELAGSVDTIRGLVGPQAMVPVRLRIEQRTRVAEGKTKQFPVVVLELRGVTSGQLLAGGEGLQQAVAAGTPQAIGGEQRAAIEAGPVPDYLGAAKAAPTLADWRKVWEKAREHGHLTDELKAQLTPIGEALASRQQEQAAAALAEPVGDPDELWMQIVSKTPDGWTTPFLEEDFAQWSEGTLPADATAEQLAGYLAELKAGRR
jgi:hypothetical protein